MRSVHWLIAAVSLPLVASAAAPDAKAQNINALFAACSQLPTQAARMECFEGVARGASSGGGAPATVYVPAPGGAPARGAPAPAGFGADSMARRHVDRERERVARGTNEIFAHAVSATDNGLGHWTIALDNGSAWQMTDAAPNFSPPEARETVRVSKGALGSYKLTVGSQASVYVVRVR